MNETEAGVPGSTDESSPTRHAQPGTRNYYFRVLAKALVLFVLFDLFQAAAHLDRRLESLSIYRRMVPPMARLDIMRDYPTPVMWRLEPLLDAHQIGRAKAPGEYRVAVLGDSGSFDLFSPARDAIPGQMTRLGARIENRTVRAYNLSYQTPNPLKDLVVLEHALGRAPDAVVWFVTLYDLASDAPPPFRPDVHLVLRVNRDDLQALAARFSISTWETRALFGKPDRWWRHSILFRGDRYRDFALLLARGALDAMTPGDPSDTRRPRRPWIGSAALPDAPLFQELGPNDPPMPNARWKALEAGAALARERRVRSSSSTTRSSARPARGPTASTIPTMDARSTIVIAPNWPGTAPSGESLFSISGTSSARASSTTPRSTTSPTRARGSRAL